MSTMDILKDLAEAVKATGTPQTQPYDTPATVRRVEGGVAWVHIPGGVDETPVNLTIDAKPGDTVMVRVSGGRGWIIGNPTAPPTDNTRAEEAIKKAEEAGGTATNFVTDTSDGIFVHPKDNDSDGVRITNAIEIIKGGLSFFKAWVENGLAKVRVGKADAGHTIIDSNGMRVYGGDGSEQLANIGYGEATAIGQIDTAPYYTFGIREGGIGAYSAVEGYQNEASEIGAHAGGSLSKASAPWAFAHGHRLKADYTDQMVVGVFNVPKDKPFIIGNGMPSDDDNDRSNAFEVDWNGVVWAAGGYSELVEVEDVPLTVSFAAGTIGTRAASLSAGSIVKNGYTYIGAYVADHRNTSYFSATIAHNGPNGTAHLIVNRATGNAVTDADVTVRKIWLKTGA